MSNSRVRDDRPEAAQALDARLRERVAELHQPAGPEQQLGADAEARVLSRLQAEAPLLAASRKRVSQLRTTAAILLLSAAAVLLYVRATRVDHSPTALPPQAARSLLPSQPACALPALADDALAGNHLALAGLGSLVLQPQSRVHVEHSSACELALRLESGTLAGDLHNLRPARLSIRTSQGEVIVTGTRFSVHSDGALEVLLESGVVDVQLRDGSALRLQPQSRLRHPGGAARAALEPLSRDDVQRLSGWLESPPVPAAVSGESDSTAQDPAPLPSNALLSDAETARRTHNHAAAREAYRAASRGGDEDAEVALLRWARMELELNAAPAALRLLNEHARRFKRGALGAEAGWLEVQVQRALGERERAAGAARRLLTRHPRTPQAAAARKLLDAP